VKSLRIVIILFHSSQNIGDRAILESTIDRLRVMAENTEFVIIANYPEEPYFNRMNIVVEPSPWVHVGKTENQPFFYQLFHFLFGIGWAFISKLFLLSRKDLPFFVPHRWRNLFQTYLDADIIIGSGGNQFYSSGRFGWPFPLNAMSVWLAHIFQKPLFIMPQSIGPLKRIWERYVLASLYRKNRLTFLRDNRSLSLAKRLNLSKNVIYAPDLAFRSIDLDSKKAIRELEQWGFNESTFRIGMTIIAPMGFALNKNEVENYYSTLIGLIERMIRTINCEVYLFRQVSGPTDLENDGLVNELISSRIKSPEKESVHVVNCEYSTDLMMALYGQMDLFVASRLHSGIFALCSRRPTVFIGYLSKTMGVLEALGLETWGLELRNINHENVWQLVENAWEQRCAIGSYLNELMPQVFQQTDSVIKKIQDDYKRLIENS